MLIEHTQYIEQLVCHEEPPPKQKEPPALHEEHSLPVRDQSNTAVTGHEGGNPSVPHRSVPSLYDTGQGIASAPVHGSSDVAELLPVRELTHATDHSTDKYSSSTIGKTGGKTDRLEAITKKDRATKQFIATKKANRCLGKKHNMFHITNLHLFILLLLTTDLKTPKHDNSP